MNFYRQSANNDKRAYPVTVCSTHIATSDILCWVPVASLSLNQGVQATLQPTHNPSMFLCAHLLCSSYRDWYGSDACHSHVA